MNTVFMATTDFDGLFDVCWAYGWTGVFLASPVLGPPIVWFVLACLRPLALVFYPRRYKYRLRALICAFICLPVPVSYILAFVAYLRAVSGGPQRPNSEAFLVLLGVVVGGFVSSLSLAWGNMFLPSINESPKSQPLLL